MTEEQNKKTASLDQILEAVAKKESVIRPFKGKKSVSENVNSPNQSPLRAFFNGLLFGLGFIIVAGLGLYIVLKLNQLHKANLIFYKLVYTLKALGR
jgi:hypothetical protein